jgi:4-hydroxybenzoate polyprenyltransferase
VASSTLLMVAAWQLNHLAFVLSPIALAIVLFYSFTKRFTRWSHLVLGFALGIAPAAAWIAVRGTLDPRILLLTAAVTCWVAGFDVLYACQDFDFDRSAGLHSIPRFLGIRRALVVARVLHAVMLLLLAAVVSAFGLGWIALSGVVLVALLLAYEHSLVAPDDLSKLNAAFFTTNGVISLVLFIFIAADLLIRR